MCIRDRDNNNEEQSAQQGTEDTEFAKAVEDYFPTDDMYRSYNGYAEAGLEVRFDEKEQEGSAVVYKLSLIHIFVDETAKTVIAEKGAKLDYLIGTMIEIPRACLTADKIAKEAEFFSFGTNDLTQMTYGLSRDDAGKILADYIDKIIYEGDPTAKIDREGVGQMCIRDSP